MISYKVKVPSAGVFVWGSNDFNTDIVRIGSANLIVSNSEFGEPVELHKEPNVGGSGGLFVTLEPGETVSFELTGCKGIRAICGTENADSQVQCFIAHT